MLANLSRDVSEVGFVLYFFFKYYSLMLVFLTRARIGVCFGIGGKPTPFFINTDRSLLSEQKGIGSLVG